MRGLLIGDDQRADMRDLRERASAGPIDMPALKKRIATKTGKTAHMRQMTAQTIVLPFGFLVTYSIETGHPCGTARHLSVSLVNAAIGKMPHPIAVWEIASEFGFTGALEECAVWIEALEGHGHAINVVQPLEVTRK